MTTFIHSAPIKATTFGGVPTLFSALLEVPVGDADVSTLKYASCGAAPMPVEVFRAFGERTGIKILEGYGLTKGTVAASTNPKDGERRIVTYASTRRSRWLSPSAGPVALPASYPSPA